jgi:uncharacterized membrane protein YoaK (UPF0700 family)
MKLSFSQKLGIALIVVSAGAAVAIQAVTGNLVHVTTEAEPPLIGKHVASQVFFMDIVFTWRYALPLGAGAACGLLLLLVPIFRKPAP